MITTQEAGAGAGKSGGLFNNFVWGGKGTTVFDYAGEGISVSGSYNRITGAVTVPFYGDVCEAKFFYEVGFSPASVGGRKEAGITITFGQVVYHTDIFGETGRWWGNFLYDLLHSSK